MNWHTFKKKLLGGGPPPNVARTPTLEDLLDAEAVYFGSMSIRVRENWQLMQLLQQKTPEVFRHTPWYDARTHNWVPPTMSERREVYLPGETFDGIGEADTMTWPVLVQSLLECRLPDVNFDNMRLTVDEMEGSSRPRQKLLYVSFGDNPRVLIKSFRYFGELDSDETMLAKIMLLGG